MKLTQLLTLGLIFLLSTSLVIAAGTSTGAGQRDPAPSPTVVPENTGTSCEDLDTVQERVECRLTRGNPQWVIPEGCREAADVNGCNQLYRNVQACYDLIGTAKDSCFKRLANFQTANVRAEAEAGNVAGVQLYVLFLLYDVQHRVENEFDAGRITAADAATVITKSVDAKHAVWQGASSAQLRGMVADLKASYRGVIQ